MSKSTAWLVGALIVVVFALRLMLASSAQGFSDDDSYFWLRQVQSIHDTGRPLTQDTLGYEGNRLLFSPIVAYILALPSFVSGSVIALKVLPNLFAALSILLVFLLAKKLTHDENGALIAAFISGFVPVFFSSTVNSLSPTPIIIFFTLAAIYLFSGIERPTQFYSYLAVLVLLAFSSPAAIIFVAGIGVYILLSLAERIPIERVEVETFAVSAALVLWAQIVLFKPALLFHGWQAIWQNIPASLLSEQFSRIPAIEAVYLIGIVPVILGAYQLYHALFREHRREAALLTSLTAVTAALLWLKLLPLTFGMSVMGVFLALLVADMYPKLMNYVSHTKVASFRYSIVALFVIVIIASSVVPSILFSKKEAQNGLSDGMDAALTWVRENTQDDALVIVPLEDAYLVEALAQRKTVADKNFLTRRDVSTRLHDLDTIYTSESVTDAVAVLSTYKATHVMITSAAREKYGDSLLPLTSSSQCLQEIHREREDREHKNRERENTNDIIVYEVTCKINKEAFA